MNLSNRTMFCRDNIDILQNINSECIDLIYLDPPFNKKKVFTAPVGSSAEGASFSDIFRLEDVKEEWVQTIKEDHFSIHEVLGTVKTIEGRTSYNYCYLAYMAIRLIECHRILKNTGAVYLHCDPTMSHYLKILLDCIFGERHFINEIIWKRQTAKKGSQYEKRSYGTLSDFIFFYVKSNNYYFNIPRTPLDRKEFESKFNRVDENNRLFRTDNIILPRGMRRVNLIYDYKGYVPEHGWMVSKEILMKMDAENRIFWSKSGRPYRKYFADEYDGKEVSNIWVDISVASGGEKTGYPTQKPLALLERLIKASCPEDGVVLDPFCGCATTCIASEKLGRRWVGIDVSVKAYDLVRGRLRKEIADPSSLFDWDKKIIFRTDQPKRTDSGEYPIEQKFVYVISNEKYEGEYKVGIAKDWEDRLNNYQTSDPDRAFKMEYKLLTPHFRKLEKHIHAVFPNKREWVQADLKDIIQAMKAYQPEQSQQ